MMQIKSSLAATIVLTAVFAFVCSTPTPLFAEGQMAVVLTYLKIGEYAKWRSGYDMAKPFRDKAGIAKSVVFRNADDPTEVMVWNETTDVAKTRELLSSPELRKAMADAGVEGTPQTYVIPK